MDTDFECVVIGGGAAGLSAALVLGRARRKTLVIDAGEQSNRADKGIGGMLGNNGTPPGEFYETASREVGEHPTVELTEGSVVSAVKDGDAFRLTTAGGDELTSGRVILATGMKYEYPELPGIEEIWGSDAFHCPFCHGWEARDGHIAVLMSDLPSLMRARLIKLWSDRITVLTDGNPVEDKDQLEELASAEIQVDDRPLRQLIVSEGSLDAIELDDGGWMAFDSLMVPVTMRHRSDLAAQLGAETKEGNPVILDALKVDFLQHTNVPGLSAAGDIATEGAPTVAAAINEGHRAGAGVVHDIAFG